MNMNQMKSLEPHVILQIILKDIYWGNFSKAIHSGKSYSLFDGKSTLFFSFFLFFFWFDLKELLNIFGKFLQKLLKWIFSIHLMNVIVHWFQILLENIKFLLDKRKFCNFPCGFPAHSQSLSFIYSWLTLFNVDVRLLKLITRKGSQHPLTFTFTMPKDQIAVCS